MKRGKPLVNKHVPWCSKCLKYTKFRIKKFTSSSDSGSNTSTHMMCKKCNCEMYTPEYSESIAKNGGPLGCVSFFIFIGFIGVIIQGEKYGILVMTTVAAVALGVCFWLKYYHKKRYDSWLKHGQLSSKK